MILCDIGNSYYHFYQDGELFDISVDSLVDLKSDKIYLISVNEKAKIELQKRYDCIDLSKFIQFKTEYEGLGVDRIFASYLIDNGVVIDAGSAITVDFMRDGAHCGGFILAGFSALERLYPQISPKLNYKLNRTLDLTKIPNRTSDAISYAILNSVIKPIQTLTENLPLYFTGGDGLFLSKLFPNSTFQKDLIFQSMLKVIEENNL